MANTEWKDLYGDKRFFVFEEGEITIWCKDKPEGEVHRAWLRQGIMAVPRTVTSGTFQEVLDKCREAIRENYFWCTRCGVKLTKAAGSHFAGHYCAICWEAYKHENSRKCRLCGRPLYDCTC